jgi:plastocyanin
MDVPQMLRQPAWHDRRVGILALAGTLALAAAACAGASPSISPPAAAMTPSPAVIATESPSRPAAATTIPTLASTTVDATVAPPGSISLRLTEDAGPRFQPGQATAKAGTVVFFLQNMLNVAAGPFDHNIALGPRLHVPLANSAFIHSAKSAVFTLVGVAPGTYTFWCQVSDHAAKGMVGTLTVTP